MADMSWEHASEARAALNAIVTDPEHGAAALSSPQTMSNLLKDLLPDAPREKGILVAAAEAGLADALRDHVAQGMDPATATRLAASSLAISAPFTPEACNWVTGEIAIALGISQPNDVDRPGGTGELGGMQTQAAGTGYSPGDAPTQGYAIPQAPGFGQAPAGGFGQGPGQGLQQAGGPGSPQAGFGSFPQGGTTSNPQAAAQSNPQGGFGLPPQAGAPNFQKAGSQSDPQAVAQSNPQGGFGSFPQAGAQSNPQGAFQGFAQPGGQGSPLPGGAGYQPAPGFGQVVAPGYKLQPGIVGPRNNSLAIVAMICGCAQFVLWFVLLVPGFLSAISALICGLVSLRQIAARAERGRGMAITGVILGALGVLGGVILIILVVIGTADSGGYGN
jgi:hypothetical protein